VVVDELMMKNINQQETIDFLLKELQNRGLNVFNRISAKDSSLLKTDHERTETDKFYYSQDVMIRAHSELAVEIKQDRS